MSAPNSNSSQNGGWGSAQIISGGSGVGSPVAFGGTGTDTTVGQTLFSFSQMKGQGFAEHNQSATTTTCTLTTTGTLADFLAPGATPPPGTALTDTVEFDETVTVVLKGNTTIG